MMPPIAFVLGGARSGKSRLALALATGTGLARTLIATAEPLDAEMEDRIARHRAERPPGWTVLEVPLELPETLAATTAPDRVVLVDCLTLWLSNLMLAGRDPEDAGEALAGALAAAAGPVVLVANEVGLGIVPENGLARAFRDAAGRLNQRVAAVAGLAVFTAAGLPVVLKRPAVGPFAGELPTC